MKLVRHGQPGEERPGVLLDNSTLLDVGDLIHDYDASFFERDGCMKLRDIITDKAASLPIYEIGSVRLGSPVATPSKIICFGLNYAAHSQEFTQKNEAPAEPALFLKAPSALSGPDDNILIPRDMHKLDYEIELAVIIGARGRYISKGHAAQFIAGYSLMCDVSERTMQLEMGGQWTKGKSHDSFAPLGPCMVTSDEFGDPQSKLLTLKVNGETRQSDTSASMLHDVYTLVSYASRFMTLMPGDIISTGSPAGVAMGRPEQDYLLPGDIVELSCPEIGTSRHLVVPCP